MRKLLFALVALLALAIAMASPVLASGDRKAPSGIVQMSDLGTQSIDPTEEYSPSDVDIGPALAYEWPTVGPAIVNYESTEWPDVMTPMNSKGSSHIVIACNTCTGESAPRAFG